MNILKEAISRPALKMSVLEELARVPKRTLYQFRDGSKKLDPKHIWNLCSVLSEYHLELKGYKFYYDQDTDIFIVEVKNNELSYSEEKDSYFVNFDANERFVIENSKRLIEFLESISD